MASAAGLLCLSHWQGSVPILLSTVTVGLPLLLGASESAAVVLSVVFDHGAVQLASGPSSILSQLHLQAQQQHIYSEQAGQPHVQQERLGMHAYAASHIGVCKSTIGFATGPDLTEIGYWVHPAISESSLQLQTVSRLPDHVTSGLACCSAMEVYAPMHCNQAAVVACTALSSDAIIDQSQKMGSLLLMLQLQFLAQDSLQLGAVEKGAVRHGRAETCRALEESDVERLRVTVLTTLIGAASLLLGTDVMPEQPLMEAGLDSIGDTC